MITPENLKVHELIGLRTTVSSSASLPHKELRGTVVDETKNTIVLLGKDGVERAIPKKGSIFRFTLPGGCKADVDGGAIAFRPYDRPKKVK